MAKGVASAKAVAKKQSQKPTAKNRRVTETAAPPKPEAEQDTRIGMISLFNRLSSFRLHFVTLEAKNCVAF